MRLLCVDDDADFLDLTRIYLERSLPEATIYTAPTVMEAVSIVESTSITCVVSDFEMPDRTGLEFLKTVREDDPALPFILFTGKGSEEIASEAISAGVTDYLQKRGAEQYDRLAARIRHAVEEYHSTRALAERVKELSAIQHVSSLLADTDGEVQLQDVVEYLPKSVQYPDLAVARIELSDETFTSRDDADPEISLTVYEETFTGDEVSLSIGYVQRPPVPSDSEPFLDEERTLLETILRLVASSIDRNQVTSKYREAYRRLQLILENTTAVLYLKDMDGRYVFVNDEFNRLFGLTDEAVVGRTDSEIHPRSIAEDVVANDRKVLETGEPIEVEERIDSDGRERTYLSLKVPAKSADGVIEGVFGVSTEITDRTERERQLEALNQTISQLLTATTIEDVVDIGVEAASEVLGLRANAIHLYDESVDGLVPKARTDGLTELIGDPPTFTPGESIAWRVYEEGTPTAVDDVRQDPDVHKPETSIRSELYLPLAEYGILVAGSATPAEFDEGDETVGALLASHIVTALRQVDNRRRLRERESELEDQNERLEQFASMVSHDLRNPVSIAQGNLELYEETGDEATLETVQRSLDRIQELITDLTALARYGISEFEQEPLEITDVASEAWEMIDTRSATLETTACRVTGDASKLKGLFENLFRNAVGHGGPDVTVRVRPLENGFYLEDTGAGIPPAKRELVFEHGFTTGYGGSGIGLTIVERIADAHGWRIDLAESAEGGARFEFRVDPSR